ncbi:MAG TPA: YggS family pyridoxal phosphate-dependent enzyme [Acidimicrobiaceae bacterium]|nr:YggS family pyridoxal phosphate-dependent enzyme [Acidimicrobiaceae bacterium]
MSSDLTPDEVCDPALDQLVAERLEVVRERIRLAGGIGVEVLPVTKTFPPAACWAAFRAGCSAVGENYAQEVVAKFGAQRSLPFGVHFIGQLQTNKVRLLAPLVTCYETIDRESVLREVAKRVPGAAVLVQVNTSSEPGKGGCAIDQVPELVERAVAAGLRVRGLMTVGPTVGGPEDARPGFRAVRALCDSLSLEVCSMGMTADLDVAVQEGATEVRVGSALFGGRPPAARAVR